MRIGQTLGLAVSLVTYSRCFVLCYLKDDCLLGCFPLLADLKARLYFLMGHGMSSAKRCVGVTKCEEVLILLLLEIFAERVLEWKPLRWYSWVVASVFVFVKGETS